MSERFDNLYSQHENVFGCWPSDEVSRIPTLMKTGSVIDVGAGDGRNALHLAKNGFDVRAIDTSTVALQKINSRANRENTPITTELIGLENYSFTENLDVYILEHVLHFVSRDVALEFIKNMQAHTNVGGVNIVDTFTTNSDFYRNTLERSNFYVIEDELLELYKEWEIIVYKKTKGLSAQTDAQGNHFTVESVTLLARKK